VDEAAFPLFNGERRSWRTRSKAYDSVEGKYEYDRALAHRSAWVKNLALGVGAGNLPMWPVVIQEHETYTFGSCRLPLGEYKSEKKLNTYVRNAPVCAPSKGWLNEQPDPIDADERGYALVAVNYDHANSPRGAAVRIQMQPDDNPSDTPDGAQYSATAHDVTKTMVWTGYVRAPSIPIHLRGALGSCLVYRRIVKDLDDNNVTIDDACAMLRSRAHLARELCETPRALEVTMFYCEHPQRVATQSADMAAPSVAVRTSQSQKSNMILG
jgi:hypothetical protein